MNINVETESKFIRVYVDDAPCIKMEVQEAPIIRIIDSTTEVLRIYDAEIKAWVEKKIQEAVVPEQKEVINCTIVADIADVDDGEEGMFYLVPPLAGSTNPDAVKGQLYQYAEGEFVRIDGSKSVIYVGTKTEGTETITQMFVFDGDKYDNVTGQKVDDTLYVTNINTDLNEVFEQGMYKVCCTTRKGTIISVELYNLSVAVTTRRGSGFRNYNAVQTLTWQKGYRTRSCSGQEIGGSISWGNWTDWTEFLYASKAEVSAVDVRLSAELEKVRKIAAAGL